MTLNRGAFRCAPEPCHSLTVSLFAAILVVFSGMARGQLRDSFEGPERTWQISKEADCGVRVLAHDRPYRESHSGQACEHFRLHVGNGTFLPLVHPIGRAPLIQEFRPTLYVKADRPSLQLMVRVVFPRNVDRGSGRAITSLLRGDMYTDVGQWQQLAIRDVARLLEQETRNLRTQFGSEIDPREAYVDYLVLNAYSSPGTIDLWIDDLEINGYINLDSSSGPQIQRGVGSAVPTDNSAAVGGANPTSPPSAPSVQGSLLIVRGRPFMPRAIQHRGEPLEWLSQLGFNTIKLSASPSPADLKEARRLRLSLIAPPPYVGQTSDLTNASPGDAAPLDPASFDSVIAWSIGTRLAERDIAGSRDLATEIRTLDPQKDRPLLVGADSALPQYSRLAQLLMFERPNLCTSNELSDLRSWLLSRSRLARPGTPALAAIETERPPRLTEQLLLFSRGAPSDEDVDPAQLRLQTFHAIAAGARGFVFPTEKPLAIDTGPAALRTDAIRLINMELRLLEPWIAAGQLSDEMSAGDGTLQVSVLATERSRLLILTQHAAAQQFVLGPPPRSQLSVLVPGVGVSDKAYLVSFAGIKSLKIAHTSGGARVTLDDAPHAAAIVITQDPLAMLHLNRTLSDIKSQACALRCDMLRRRLAHTAQVDRQLADLGHPLPTAAKSLADATTQLQQAEQLFAKLDFENAHKSIDTAEQHLARVRRGHWEQTAAAFPSSSASPCIAQFTTLPLHWAVADRMRRSPPGPNEQAAGDMESLDQMLQAGWRRVGSSHQIPAQQTTAGTAHATDEIPTDVSLSLADPHSGRSALRLQAWATDPKKAPLAIERPPLWVTSSPVPVRQGQLVRIHGWANVPRRLAASTDGLLIFDSLGGSDLGERIRSTQGWREFTLYRAVPQNGELIVTFTLTGLGEASLDDLSVSLLDPEPLRPR